MKAKLKRIHSPDIDIDSFWPDDPACFSFLLQAMIGPEDQEGEESFSIQVCTPDWLKSRHSETDILFGRHMILVFDYDLDRIKSHIARYCEHCIGEDWQSVADKLSRIGQWEFEDYQPYNPHSTQPTTEKH
jgi:hypothetical protein